MVLRKVKRRGLEVMVEGRCAVTLESQRADERRGTRHGRQGDIAVWCWENVPEMWKPGLEHHTHLIACFLEKQYVVKSSQEKNR